ncbi:hypothetical protein CDL15_Pgr021075 [Punica granatum]|uniref:Uncharacterized protein n=1 Tax=Punica granatum TaxID=22663 RepID=A0A218WS70_PUNGR|nr:hypothetical protein CDL15_Pgr021075 [Punica granatum]
MTGSVPTSLAGVTHYGDLGANFNQGGPSVRHLPKLCWHKLQPRMPQCTSFFEDVLAELQPRMPQCTSLGTAHHEWMMSEVVSVRALNANVPVFIVDVTCGGLLVQSSFSIVFCGSSVECMLERYALEADGHACLSIEMVALKVYGSFGRCRLQFHRGYLLVEPLGKET